MNCTYTAFAGMGVDGNEAGDVHVVGQSHTILQCSMAVLKSFPDAWAAVMTNPYGLDGLETKQGPFNCLAISRSDETGSKVVENH